MATEEESQRPLLRIKNSKHTNGRANGEYRELYLDGLEKQDIDQINAALACCKIDTTKSDLETLKKVQSLETALRNELENARNESNKETGQRIKAITLYSFRHQFIADAKATFNDPVIVSAMVGRKSTRTAFSHYGKRVNGRNNVKVTPTKASIEAVQTIRTEMYVAFVSSKDRDSGPSMF